jgi:polyisoprenoid-binding protein YceI
MPDSVHIFTYKRGLLSRLAHDLRLSVERFELELDGSAVIARFHASSLRVDGTVKKGRLDPRGLSPKDVRDVLDNTRDRVLHSRRFPLITFTGQAQRSPAALAVAGTLDMVGRRAPISLSLRIQGDRARGQVELQPSRWGIQPFEALMGAIALQDRVVVAFDLALPPEG